MRTRCSAPEFIHRFSPYQPVSARLAAVFGSVIAPFIVRFCPFISSLNERKKKIFTTVRPPAIKRA
jgi:hypothetical protein